MANVWMVEPGSGDIIGLDCPKWIEEEQSETVMFHILSWHTMCLTKNSKEACENMFALTLLECVGFRLVVMDDRGNEFGYFCFEEDAKKYLEEHNKSEA